VRSEDEPIQWQTLDKALSDIVEATYHSYDRESYCITLDKNPMTIAERLENYALSTKLD
jgi:hypothetical protein